MKRSLVLLLFIVATVLSAQQSGLPSNVNTNNVLVNSPTTGLFFVEADSIGLASTGNFPADLAVLLGVPSGNRKITAVGSSSLADIVSCHTAGAGNCTQDGTYPLTWPQGVTSNSKTVLQHAYNDLSNMTATPTNPQLSYYGGGLKALTYIFAVPDSQKIAANNTTYCTTTGTWTAASGTLPGGAGTFPAGSLQTSTNGATLTCTMQNATDAGFITLKNTTSAATFTISVTNPGSTGSPFSVTDPYTGSSTLNQTAPYTSSWGGVTNFYAVGYPNGSRSQSPMSGGYTTVVLTSTSANPLYVIGPYFISPSSSLQNYPAVAIMLESWAGCNGTCSTVAGALHNDSNTNIMRAAQIAVANELRSNGLNVSYFDPNATPSGFNSSDVSGQTIGDGTHPNSTGGANIAATAFPILNSAATTADHFLPGVGSSFTATTCPAGAYINSVSSSGVFSCSASPACGAAMTHYAAIAIANASGGSDLSNYPTLLGFNGASTNSITLTNLKVTGSGGQVQSSSGLDITFCTAATSGTTLPFERVSYTGSTGAAEFYVNIPTLSASSGATIYMFWGDASATDSAQPAVPWTLANYAAVYHFGGTSLSGADSIGTNALTNSGSAAGVAGQFGEAVSVGTGDRMYNNSVTAIPTGTSQRTIEAWVKFPSTPNGISFGYGSNGGNDGNFASYATGGTIYIWENNAVRTWGFTYAPNTAWHYYVNSLTTGTTSADVVQYLDGAVQTSTCSTGVCSATLTTATTSTPGIQVNGVPGNAGGSLVVGVAETVDEFRISNVGRTAGWVATQYANQNNPSTFVTVGTIH